MDNTQATKKYRKAFVVTLTFQEMVKFYNRNNRFIYPFVSVAAPTAPILGVHACATIREASYDLPLRGVHWINKYITTTHEKDSGP